MKITRFFAIIISTLLSSVVGVGKVFAQEVNPPAGSYSFGSSSEFSPYATLGQGTFNSSSTLAPTGQSQLIGYIAIVGLLLAAVIICLIVLKKFRNKTTSAK